MSFRDIFKNSFLEGYAQSELGTTSIVACLCVAVLVGIYIFAAYRILCRKSFYNKNFNVSLIAIAVITAAIILTVQSNIVLSLGMVGALSIVRFRTAIKDPMDLAFLFWSISVGIICGAGLAAIAVVLSVILSVVVWVFTAIPVAKAPMLLMVSVNDTDSEEVIMTVVNKCCKSATVKSRTFSANRLDLVIEIRCKEEGKLAKAVSDIESVTSVSVLAHDGEVTF